jgi:hypothetical protein
MFGLGSERRIATMRRLRTFKLGTQTTWTQLAVSQWAPGSDSGRGAKQNDSHFLSLLETYFCTKIHCTLRAASSMLVVA